MNAFVGNSVPYRRDGAVVFVIALGLAACVPTGSQQRDTAEAKAAEDMARQAPAATRLGNRRDLTGAGAVAFDPTAPRLAWAAGNEVRTLDLRSGGQGRVAVGVPVTDLGFAPDGSLWIVAGQAQRWRGGESACRAQDVEADRLLALDAQGAVVAGYTHSDGVGMLRRQVWLDNACTASAESVQPLPPGIADAEADPGEPLRRASLQSPRGALPPSSPHLPEGSAQARPVAASADGRWWVFEDPKGRTLWESVPAR